LKTSLIADCCPPRFNFAAPTRSRSAIPSKIGLDFSPTEDSCHKHQALRHEKFYVSGYYYQEAPADEQRVAWLAQSLDGPYAGANRIASTFLVGSPV
jgi:hypothetical protein